MKVIRTIGEGAYGIVSICEYKGKEVAVKKFKDKFSCEVLRELYFSMNLKHPNLVGALEILYDDVYHLIMEYEGITLRSFISKNNYFDRIKIFENVLHDISKALDYLVCNGLSHVDLKPENILVGDTIKLCDYSACTFIGEDKSIIFSIPYCAPELFDNIISDKTDMWALGCVLYELVANRLYIKAKNIDKALEKISYLVPSNPRQYHKFPHFINSNLTDINILNQLIFYKSILAKLIVIDLDGRYSTRQLLEFLGIENNTKKIEYRPLKKTTKKNELARNEYMENSLYLDEKILFQTMYLVDYIAEKKELTEEVLNNIMVICNDFYGFLPNENLIVNYDLISELLESINYQIYGLTIENIEILKDRKLMIDKSYEELKTLNL